jgi:S1-C subfamily serine protease
LAAVAGLWLATTGCAPDPPSAAVGIVVAGCDPGEGTGSGAVVAPGLVLTAAHVVAGADEIRVIRGERSVGAEIVGFDPDMDLAYLAVEGLAAAPLPVTSAGVEPGDHGVVYVARGDDIVAVAATVRRRVQISTEDIYLRGNTVRPGYELEADIQPGDSGAALVIGGDVVGVVWARSRADADRSYAIDPERGGALIRRQLDAGRLGAGIDPMRCP